MNNIELSQLDMINDLPIIKNWDIKYDNDPRYSSIRKYILENKTYYNIGEVIYLNYELEPIGDNERKYILAIKNDNKDLVGFMICHTFNINSTEPNLLLQYIVISPDHQHKGYGKKALKELLNNPEKYIEVAPTEIFSYIDMTNTHSLALYGKAGFGFRAMHDTLFFKSIKYMPRLEKDK